MTGFAGKIDAEDLLVALRALGFEPKKDEVKMLMSDYDKENSGAINKQQFVEIFKAKWMETIQPDVLHLAFQLYDTEGTGNISFENLRNVMDMIGYALQKILAASVQLFCLWRAPPSASQPPPCADAPPAHPQRRSAGRGAGGDAGGGRGAGAGGLRGGGRDGGPLRPHHGED
mmetsp:Transcript_42336/g.113261  ORF Transcript_42336/g.113261 Transcript_42336/m.113261 type:complete len:173 (-) Transcript_42336:45-563(-)